MTAGPEGQVEEEATRGAFPHQPSAPSPTEVVWGFAQVNVQTRGLMIS